MGRKPPSSRKQKPREELAEDTIAALAAVAGTFEAVGPARPSFIPEGYTPLTDAAASIEGGWLKLRQHLHAGRIQGFIRTEQNRLVPVPAEDWESPENDEAGQTGQVIKLNCAILGGRDLKGLALVKTSDLTAVKSTARESASTTGHLGQGRSRGRPARPRKAAKQALDALYLGRIPGKPWKRITEEVNVWLVENRDSPVSEDTVRRAAKLK